MQASASPTQYPRTVLTFLGLVLLSVVCALDVWTEAPATFAFFYLIPIYFMAWYLPVAWSAVFSLISYLVMGFADARFRWSEGAALLQSPRYIFALIFFVGTSLLMSRLSIAYHHERELSSRDYLTGVFNRREFFHLAEVERLRALRYARAMTLVFIDLDNFKTTNDRFGHAAGDQVLAVVARTLKDCIRGTDLVARLGGDEFVLLLEETDAAAARLIVSKVRETLADQMAQSTSKITTSMGVVTFLIPPGSVDEMVRLGDQLMYSAKHQGGDRAIFQVSDGPLEQPETKRAAGA